MNNDSPSLCLDVDILPSGIIAVDGDRKIVYSNQFAKNLLSDKESSIVGQRIENVLTPASNIFIDSYVYPLLLENSKAEEIQLNLKTFQTKTHRHRS